MGASADGSRVIFTTGENLLASDSGTAGQDLYQYSVPADAQGHHLRCSHPTRSGAAPMSWGCWASRAMAAAVYFLARSQIVAGQPTAGSGFRIFRWSNGVVHYVTRATNDASQSSTIDPLISEFGGWPPLAGSLTSRVTPDGSRLLFVSAGTDELPHSGVGDTCTNVDSGNDEPLCHEVFLYDANADGGDGSVVCVSCVLGDPQAPASSSASFLSEFNKGGAARTSHLTHPISDDGRFVFFDTGEALLPSDEDGVARDVYEYDSLTGELHLLSSGKPGSFGATFEDASPSGSDVFFATRDQLSPWDIDDNVDLYDARVNGGIAGPVGLGGVVCGSDTCRVRRRTRLR